jgi:hypothetical protein
LKLERAPHLTLELLPMPVLNWPLVSESVLGTQSRFPIAHALILLGEVFTGVYFLLEMSLLGMNVDWFILKLVNCLRKTCGWSMRQP